MKFLVFVTLASFVAIALAEPTEDQIFNDYVSKYNVRFRRKVDFDKIKKNIVRKYHTFEEENAKGIETFNRTLYPFSYLDDDEFGELYLGAPEPEPDQLELNFINETEQRGKRALKEPPEDYFLWPDSIVGSVKSQGQCGSCYAFAAIGVIKSRMAVKYGSNKVYDLSEQDAMECTRGCRGGWDYSIYRDYSQKYGGCAAYNYQKLHSYSGIAYSCPSISRPRVPNSKVLNYGYLANNEKTIRQHLVTYGPLYTRFNVYNNFYEYSSGIYTHSSGSFVGGHAIILIGYGVENGVKYWILRNSWDSWWGEKGNFRMIRGINLNGIEASVSVVLDV